MRWRARAGCGAPIDCDAPEVELALFQGETDDVLVLINHAPAKRSVGLTSRPTRRVGRRCRGGAQSWQQFRIDPNGVVAVASLRSVAVGSSAAHTVRCVRLESTARCATPALRLERGAR